MAGVSGKRRIAAFWRHLDLLGNRRKPAQIASKRALDFLGIPWILSSEMSLFNGLWGNFAKKNFSSDFPKFSSEIRRAATCGALNCGPRSPARCRACWRRPWISSFANIARNSDFRKQLSRASRAGPPAADRRGQRNDFSFKRRRGVGSLAARSETCQFLAAPFPGLQRTAAFPLGPLDAVKLFQIRVEKTCTA